MPIDASELFAASTRALEDAKRPRDPRTIVVAPVAD